ncbi:MAG: hypothetical protein BroJett040_04820 [Oligoflexia bacterium]|nr:MAG: hypothetical protein BroJett040_04820 [Oligoflexia bacterium]
MIKVGTILKHLSQTSRLSPVLSTFINYLSHYYETEDFLSPDIVQSFFAECLEYPHWQQNKKQLNDEMKALLVKFHHHYNEVFTESDIKWPAETQIIEIENLKDFSDVLNQYLTFMFKQGEKFRLVYDQTDKRMLAIVLKPTGKIEIRSYSNKFIIQNGQFEPLRADLVLSYGKNLELEEGVIQKMDVGPYTTASFSLNEGRAYGCLIRGYTFQKLQELSGVPIQHHTKLFYALKHIEQFFIKRDSDPYYQNLIEELERSIHLIRAGDQDQIQKSAELMAQAQNALEYVFSDDKLLGLLIRDLQYTMAGRPYVQHKLEKTATKIETKVTQAEQKAENRTTRVNSNSPAVTREEPSQWQTTNLNPSLPPEYDLIN